MRRQRTGTGGTQVVDELAADDFAFPLDVLWLTASVIAAEAVTLVGHRRGAQLLYDRLLPHAGLIASSRVNCQGPVAYPLGLLAMMLGRPADAEAHLDVALERCTQLRAPFPRARTLVAQAQLLAERSPERSAQLAGEAAALAERYGMVRVGEQARALAG